MWAFGYGFWIFHFMIWHCCCFVFYLNCLFLMLPGVEHLTHVMNANITTCILNLTIVCQKRWMQMKEVPSCFTPTSCHSIDKCQFFSNLNRNKTVTTAKSYFLSRGKDVAATDENSHRQLSRPGAAAIVHRDGSGCTQQRKMGNLCWSLCRTVAIDFENTEQYGSWISGEIMFKK